MILQTRPRVDSETNSILGDIPDFVRDRFPTAVSEMDEAERCLLFDRSAACVFHVMRAVEVALKAAWHTLGLHPPKLADSWGQLLKPIDEQLAVPPKNPNLDWQANLPFFSELVFDIRAAKRRYRDTTMHVESTYTTEEAKAVLSAVVTMIRHAAKRLDQDGNLLPELP
jgi:HEPN domain-containing protein